MSSQFSPTLASRLNFARLLLLGVLAATLSVQGQVVSVLDDFEAGSNQNKFLGYSFFYADGADKGTSTVNSSKPGLTPTELLFDPVKSIDAGYSSTKSLKMEFTYGANKPVSCAGTCPYGQMVGFGTQFVAGTDPVGGVGEGKTLDLTGATGLTFWAKASVLMKVRVEITTSGVKDFAFHRGEVTVGTDWAQQVVLFTPGLGGINQPAWTQAPIPFDPKTVQKLQFQVSADDNPTLKAGILWLDNIQVAGYAWVPPSACVPCVGATPATGALLSDLEPGPGTPPRAANQNATGGFWYAYNDVGVRPVLTQSEYSEIFEGVNLTDPKAPVLTVSAGKGATATAGAYIKFALGPSYTEGVNLIQPFVGLGTKTSDALETMTFDATGSTGIAFDYWTDVASTFQYIRLEVKTNQTDLGTNPGAVHHVLLPATAGQWKTAIVPWNKFTLPDWQEVPDKSAPVKVSGIIKFQWAVQDVQGTTGALAVDNVKLPGLTTIGPLSIRSVNRGAKGLRMTQVGGTLNVAFDLPSGIREAQVSLIDLKGKVVASRNISGAGILQATLDTRNLRSGLYSLRVRHGQLERGTTVTLLK